MLLLHLRNVAQVVQSHSPVFVLRELPVVGFLHLGNVAPNAPVSHSPDSWSHLWWWWWYHWVLIPPRLHSLQLWATKKLAHKRFWHVEAGVLDWETVAWAWVVVVFFLASVVWC